MSRVWTIPCRTDNYTYLVGVEGGTEVAVVDPCDAEPVLTRLRAEGLRPVAILNTHHHGDHVGGNRQVTEQYPGIPVYAHSSDRGRIPCQSEFLEHGDWCEAAGLRFRVLHIPGHTRGHIAYASDDVVFIGDTLFGAGCGRLFEGTAAEMYESLNVKLSEVGARVPIYFAHEYTASNLRFAAHLEPANDAIVARVTDTSERRARGEYTTPTTLEVERATNPFLRVDEEPIRAAVAAPANATSQEVFRLVRLAKDGFR